jgi:uncharacterized protein (DUF111 family)
VTQVRVAHFDCFSGISGDMTLAALIDIGVDRDAICSGIASLGLPIEISIEKVRKGGFASTFVEITAPEETSHRFLPEIEQILSRGKLSDRQRDLALRIFQRLAKAEGASPISPEPRLDSISSVSSTSRVGQFQRATGW